MHGLPLGQYRPECWGSRVRWFLERVPDRRVRPATRSLHTETLARRYSNKERICLGPDDLSNCPRGATGGTRSLLPLFSNHGTQAYGSTREESSMIVRRDGSATWNRHDVFDVRPEHAHPIRQSIAGDATQGNELVNAWAEVPLLGGHSRNCGEQNTGKNVRINLSDICDVRERVRPFSARMDRTLSPTLGLGCDFCRRLADTFSRCSYLREFSGLRRSSGELAHTTQAGRPTSSIYRAGLLDICSQRLKLL